ncbi:unnamed protein product [Acanthoscelides obtectus]|uniref:Uncharacterized protein n=1 Tax=Acanthoscelides obtectus TaxID=200917 RepID=A0A9P0KK22_ACAOB|nr:unnamed protein product [Acanthoscelides obtectus]CAK1625643.1 hypothetical protein AOBTE_LOCUS3300 [Acanthoscelides obtectus]
MPNEHQTRWHRVARYTQSKEMLREPSRPNTAKAHRSTRDELRKVFSLMNDTVSRKLLHTATGYPSEYRARTQIVWEGCRLSFACPGGNIITKRENFMLPIHRENNLQSKRTSIIMKTTLNLISTRRPRSKTRQLTWNKANHKRIKVFYYGSKSPQGLINLLQCNSEAGVQGEARMVHNFKDVNFVYPVTMSKLWATTHWEKTVIQVVTPLTSGKEFMETIILTKGLADIGTIATNVSRTPNCSEHCHNSMEKKVEKASTVAQMYGFCQRIASFTPNILAPHETVILFLRFAQLCTILRQNEHVAVRKKYTQIY